MSAPDRAAPHRPASDDAQDVLTAPFPWFGGKRRIASIVWSRFGCVDSYNEPFAGSLAVLLGRPHPPRIETVNDLDCYLANFWRALQHDPDTVARCADWPVNEADLHARHQWLSDQRAFRDRMLVDPDYFDARIAGWWVWGQCLWIGSGWCRVNSASEGPSANSGPDLKPRHRRWQGGGQGGGSGVHAPTLVRADSEQRLREYMRRLAARLRCVRVCCGDWQRVLAPSVSTYIGTTGVLLDPPYAQDLRARCYAQDHDISADVREWALAHGDDPKLRIALCGYEHEHAAHMPPSWTCVGWKALGGYSRSARGRTNREQERVWFSPHCLQDAPPLFRDAL